MSFKNCKIITKINYSKKQMTWEISEIKSGSKESYKNKIPSKRKFEVQFTDIEKIDLNTARSSMVIGILFFSKQNGINFRNKG